MGILADAANSISNAAERAAAAAREAAAEVAKAAAEAAQSASAPAAKLTQGQEEVSGLRSSFVDAPKRSVTDGGALPAIDVDSLKKARVGANLGAAAGNVLTASAPTPDVILKSTSDRELREAIIADPSVLNGVSPQRKGEMLEILRSGYTSDGDKHAMQFIVRSCESKEELRSVVASASGKSPPGQAEFHQYDQQLTNYHPCLIADLLNPANPKLPEVTISAAAKEAHQLDPNPSTSISPTEETLHGGGTKPLSADETARNAKVDALVDSASGRARGDAPALVKDTQAAAAGMDKLHGGDLLARTADKLITAGKYDEAKALLKDLKSAPYAGTPIDLAGAKSGGAGQYEVPAKLPNGEPNPAAGTKVYLQQNVGIQGTFDSLAQTRLNQLDQLARMDKVLPASIKRPLDGTDITQVKAYFDELKKTKSMPEVGAEFQAYLTNFAKHPAGPETTWNAPTSTLTDPAGLTKVLSGAPRDASGRMLLDCEGQSYLTGAVFGGKGSSTDAWYTSGGGHISVSVFDQKTGKGFHVNTAAKDGVVTDLNDKPPAKTDTQRRDRAWNYHAHDGKPGVHADFAPPTQVMANGDRARAGRTPD
jgi:hypothetical protein